MAHSLNSKWVAAVLIGAALIAFTPALIQMAGFVIAVFIFVAIIIVLIGIPLGVEVGYDIYRTKSLGERSGMRAQDMMNPEFNNDQDSDGRRRRGGR